MSNSQQVLEEVKAAITAVTSSINNASSEVLEQLKKIADELGSSLDNIYKLHNEYHNKNTPSSLTAENFDKTINTLTSANNALVKMQGELAKVTQLNGTVPDGANKQKLSEIIQKLDSSIANANMDNLALKQLITQKHTTGPKAPGKDQSDSPKLGR